MGTVKILDLKAERRGSVILSYLRSWFVPQMCTPGHSPLLLTKILWGGANKDVHCKIYLKISKHVPTAKQEAFFHAAISLTQILLIRGKKNSNHNVWWEPFPLINIKQIVLRKVFIWVNISISLSSFTDSLMNSFCTAVESRRNTLMSTKCYISRHSLNTWGMYITPVSRGGHGRLQTLTHDHTEEGKEAT